MSEISERILSLITKRNTSYGVLSKETGIPKSALQRYATGETTKIPLPRLESIAKALNTSPAYLLGWDEKTELPPVFQPLKTVQYIPVIGEIACGTPILAEQNIVGQVLLPENVNANLALTCKGDSMTGAGIDDGDTIFIRQQPEVENGEIAAVMIDYEATLKRVYMTDRSISLVPENPKYSPMIFMEEDMNKVQIVGKVIAVLKMIEK